MSTVDEIVAILGELNLLLHRDPDALARREQILATKRELAGASGLTADGVA